MSESNWKWQGHAGHFICADSCRFRMSTVVGSYLISTVGDYFTPAGVRSEIGRNRFFETMVFPVGEAPEPCGCYTPVSLQELDFLPANTALEATDNHYLLCRRYDSDNHS